jgi:hypothetical protein
MEWKSGLAVCVTRPGAYVDDDSCPTSTSTEEVELVYETGGYEVEESIGIVSIPSPLRHPRRPFYFLCPGSDDAPCQKRAGKLYLPPGEHFFRCRACYDLTYRSVKEHDKRLDAMTKMPAELLLEQVRGPDPRAASMALRAVTRLVRREERLLAAPGNG